MAYYHGSLYAVLEPGDEILPGRLAPLRSTWRTMGDPIEPMESGRMVTDHDLVWLTTDLAEAETWATHSFGKATWEDMQRVKHACWFVYEVEPVGEIDRRVTPHSPTELACERATVVRVAAQESFDWRDWRWERDAKGEFIIDDITG